MTQQKKQIIRNASLSLFQNYKHKNARQEHNIWYKMIQTKLYTNNVWK